MGEWNDPVPDAGQVEQPLTLPSYILQDLHYRRSDLQAGIEREKALGRRNTGLLHAANRAVRFLDGLIKMASAE